MKTALALTLLAMAPGWCHAQDQLADALRKGIVEEDTSHNLDAAIKNYQSVLARFDEERKTAAAALFRLAECYRKLGKSREAAAAYGRVVAQFSDQAALAEKSRKQLGVPPPPPPPPSRIPGPEIAEARQRYRTALHDKVMLAYQAVSTATRQLELGATGPAEVTDVTLAYLRAQRELASFDAGLSGPQAPGAAQRQEALKARPQVRELLLQEIELSRKALDLEEQRSAAGAAADIPRRKTALINLQTELAAFDAGVPLPESRKR